MVTGILFVFVHDFGPTTQGVVALLRRHKDSWSEVLYVPLTHVRFSDFDPIFIK